MLLQSIDRIHEFLDQRSLNILNDNGIFSVSEFLCIDPNKVVEFFQGEPFDKKHSTSSILNCRKFLFSHHAAIAAGSWYSNVRTKNNIIETGIKCLDNILNGGFKGGLVYEVYGLPGSGRTQLALQIAANNTLHDGNTLYIDTKNDFCIDRFCEIVQNNLKHPKPPAKRKKLSCDENDELLESYINRVRMAKVYDMESLLATLGDIVNDMNSLTRENDMLLDTWKFYRNIRLLVIDNIASVVLPMLGNDHYPMSDITALTSQLIENIRLAKFNTVSICNTYYITLIKGISRLKFCSINMLCLAC